ncbi:hypothetical protein F4859DRAFT_515401 [Xylaria cf. heliscus]|nr:hypothetical protein F4859DRAFT_515401 [Xylaria cf. heliscus]
MAPPCRVFPASQLPTEIQLDDDRKRRKGGRIDLSACELLSMVQYDCQIDRPDLRNSPLGWDMKVMRQMGTGLIRLLDENDSCRDQKGEFTVETTMWEGRTSAPDSKGREPEPGDGGGGGGGGGAAV